MGKVIFKMEFFSGFQLLCL